MSKGWVAGFAGGIILIRLQAHLVLIDFF